MSTSIQATAASTSGTEVATQAAVRPRVSVGPNDAESALERNGRELIFGDRRIEFSFDRDVGRVVVKVRQAESEEVVRQIPPEEYLRFIARFREQIGVLFDEQA